VELEHATKFEPEVGEVKLFDSYVPEKEDVSEAA
jgi:hypothetical protein